MHAKAKLILWIACLAILAVAVLGTARWLLIVSGVVGPNFADPDLNAAVAKAAWSSLGSESFNMTAFSMLAVIPLSAIMVILLWPFRLRSAR